MLHLKSRAKARVFSVSTLSISPPAQKNAMRVVVVYVVVAASHSHHREVESAYTDIHIILYTYLCCASAAV